MTVLMISGVSLLALSIIALNRPPRDGRWCFDNGERMRRYVDGGWQVRPQTAAEREEARDADIW